MDVYFLRHGEADWPDWENATSAGPARLSSGALTAITRCQKMSFIGLAGVMSFVVMEIISSRALPFHVVL